MIDFVKACLGFYCLGWLVVEALSSRWAPRILAAALVGLVVADVIHILFYR